MPDVETVTAEATYLTKGNIVHPESTHVPSNAQLDAQGLNKVTAFEAKARADLATAKGVTVSGGAIKRGK